MRLTNKDIRELPQRYRAQLINCLPGFKPAIMVGTTDDAKQHNLAIISSLFHVGANPPLLGMILRPNPEGTERHTLENILANGVYTLNGFRFDESIRAHQTAARYPRQVSEFTACGFDVQEEPGFAAPFIDNSPLRIGCELREHHELAINGTHLIIGEISLLLVSDDTVRDDGTIDLAALELAAVVGLDGYQATGAGQRFSYPKPDEAPVAL